MLLTIRFVIKRLALTKLDTDAMSARLIYNMSQTVIVTPFENKHFNDTFRLSVNYGCHGVQTIN
jgi:hypothetical protein